MLPSKLSALLCASTLLLSGNKHRNFYASSAFVPPAFFVHHRAHTKIERCQPLLGIKGFRSWFESAFPSSVKKVQHPSPVRRTPKQQRGGGASNKIDRSKSNKKTQQIETQPEVYDHVLIDANQFLHSNLRKAFNRKLKRSKGNAQFDGQNLDEDFIEYSLLLLIQDLNRLTSTVAIPRKSLVIAIDGSPGAAKLEMQRRRRHGLYQKVELQQKLLEVLRERGWTDAHFGFFNNTDKKAKNKHITLLAKHERDKVTMNITPGTAYLDRVTDALLYWSWRQVANPFWPPSPDPKNNKRSGRTKIYISPSMVPGEGEVKLLDYMLRGQDGKGRKTIHSDDSVAFIGGDSDLVLMGLTTNPSVTQNVHVILPGENSKTLMISIWETTRHLVGMLEGTAAYGKRPIHGKGKNKTKRKLTKKEIQQVRLDAVLLVILNGNDYLPKLRYSSTFDSFFEVYLDLMAKCLANRDENGGGETLKPFLINVDNNNGGIYINVPFAIAFFREMAARYCSVRLPRSGESLPSSSTFQQTELGILNNLVEARFLPSPLNFETVAPQDSMYQSQLDVDLDTIFDDDVEIVRMTIGNFPEDFNTLEIESTLIGESDGHGVISRMIKSKTSDRSYLFEIPHKQGFPNKSTKLRLACLALEEIFGKENLNVLFGAQDDDDDDDENVGRQLAPAEPVSYLGGLLWTLETYRTGACADYGYNYGRKSAPSALELVSLLEQHGQKVSRFDLLGDSDVAPLSDGMSCLAALPPQAHSILEEPYSWLVEPSSRANFEEIYESCFSDGVFDSKSFADKCSKQIHNMRSERSISKAETANCRMSSSQNTRGRHIQSSSKYWTVLSLSNHPLEHPFAPPEPICDRTPRLKTNKRVRASKLPVSHALPPPVL
eukprot:scaffold2884_cov141-Skeletonema_menzelii.AAC.2